MLINKLNSKNLLQCILTLYKYFYVPTWLNVQTCYPPIRWTRKNKFKKKSTFRSITICCLLSIWLIIEISPTLCQCSVEISFLSFRCWIFYLMSMKEYSYLLMYMCKLLVSYIIPKDSFDVLYMEYQTEYRIDLFDYKYICI